jgi:DNA modification methylase
MNLSYKNFIESKQISIDSIGFEINYNNINPILFDFQKDIVKWSVKKGRCAVFLDTGLGKTFIQLEWARILNKKTLIFAPLSVSRQTIKEGKKINVDVKYVRDKSELMNGINITNYEMLEHFIDSDIESIILDESSILKSLASKTRKKLIDNFANVKFKMCCTATPAPNDFTEIGNHAQFLNICSMQEMLAMFFINANKEHTYIIENKIITRKGSNKGGQEWRLKHHAEDTFFKWLSKWAILMTKPSDLGYEDDGFILPELKIKPIFINTEYKSDTHLFFNGLSGLGDRASVRRQSIQDKITTIKELINTKEQTIIWCGLDKESTALKQELKNISIEVKGSNNPEFKIKAFEDFQDGKYPVLITKAKIGGFGMNFQNANNMIFFGLNDSWETYYQAIRREWRFGQDKPVNVYIILSQLEEEIYSNILRKDKQSRRLRIKMIEQLKDYEKNEMQGIDIQKDNYVEDTIETDKYKIMLGDSCTRIKELEDNSVDLSIYSPPFADLFVYSNSLRDLGNCKNWDEFFIHYGFIVSEVLRITRPGRLSCVHTSDIPAMANRDGYIGLKDFPGKVIKLHEDNGWIFVGRALVQKNPQAQAIRVKSKSLLFVQMNKDSSHSRPALVDHVLIFKKPGDNKIPITPVENGELDNEKWISWAHGIWTDINETETLQYYQARHRDDEKHICPLQLGTIERCIKLYSNPGELVFTPFMGIGSEAFMALKLKRKAIGIELKKSYFDVASKNLNSIQTDLFDMAVSR